MVVPSTLEEAKRFFIRLPPAPPGRNIVVPMSLLAKKARRCHGCHGWNDERHALVPHGANRCTLEHDDRCPGGILEGKDRKGRDWQPCPVGYVSPFVHKDSGSDDFTDNDEDGNESENSERNNEVSESSSTHTHSMYTAMPGACSTTRGSGTSSLFTPVSSAHSLLTTVSSLQSSPLSRTGTASLAQQAVFGAHSLPSPSLTLTVSAAQAPISSTSQVSPPMDDRAELEQLRRQCQALEDQAREQAHLLEEHHASAERMELKRQVQAEKERLEMLKRSSKHTNVGHNQSPHMVNNMRQQSNLAPASSDFPNFYQGPNIKEIRKTTGLRGNAEKVVESVRSDIASLGRRPTASQHDGSLGARTKNQSIHPHNLPTVHKPVSKEQQEYKEFMEFKAWKERNAAMVADTDSGSDASPPRATLPTRQSGGNRRGLAADPPTDPSSSEDESGQPVILVYRRDKNGLKYRSYEPYHVDSGTVSRDKHVKYAWVTDPETGREYKQAVPSKPAKSSKQLVSGSGHHITRHVDHRAASETPETGHRRGMRSPSRSQQHVSERVPGIVPLQDKEGKSDDRKTLTITDWAKNCPVAYAEKIKYDEINLPIWVWAYVSEILSSRSGLSPDMPRGELEARLQHLLCVLQVALVNSEKTDFSNKGWSIASIYAKRVQQKLDRGLETWEDFKRFGYDPHPSEMFTAKTEVDKRAPNPNRKKKEEEKPAGAAKRLCTTWNNCEVERKCQYLVDYPSATKCNKRHDCSYCQEKGYGTLNHQRRFCKRRRDAGDE